MARAPPAAMSMSWRSMGLVSSVFKGAYYFVDESGLGRTCVFGAAGGFAGFAFGGCLGLLWGTVAAAVLEVGLELLLHFQALFLGLVATGCQYPQGELVLLAVGQLELDFDFVVWHGVGFVGIKDSDCPRIGPRICPRISRIDTNRRSGKLISLGVGKVYWEMGDDGDVGVRSWCFCKWFAIILG